MEKKRSVECLLMVCMVLGVIGVFARECRADNAAFKQCYGICFVSCVLTTSNTTFGCAAQCLKDCILTTPSMHESSTPSMHTLMNTDNFCKLGCATSLCTHISTKHDPADATSFKQCYGICFITCVLTSANTTFGCAAECLKDCILTPPPIHTLMDTNNFCKLGCATSLCTHFSTKHDPAAEKVEGCVNSCSETCIKS
ncbi:hypothetical protein Ddye_011214 [Dipteronia dyeriana]|uniref:Thionin-like protein 2 n=1 Tax=Dipteronia dyeriana TaxID=168575 RepID=A0AAD9UBT0_9ROSI|nr:hypothetical protein Ddye_011214 [Dipteronia dyeriana]